MSSPIFSRLRTGVAGIAALTLLAGCSSNGSNDTSNADGDTDGNFPVTIEHEFGSTEIESEPTRIVTLGVTDADIVLAMGEIPVGNTGYSFFDNGLGPWTDDLVDGADLTYIESDSDPNLEQVASLEPDLIIGISAGFDGEVYEQLSDIAPVVARPAGSTAYSVPREEATDIVAKSMGNEERGKEINDEVAELIATAREENPEFEGKTGTVILPYDNKYGAYLPGDSRGQFLESLGLDVPQAILDQDTGDSFFVELSKENIEALEGDLLLVLHNEEDFDIVKDNPLFATLEVVQNDGVVLATTDQRGAITYNSVLSIPYAIDQLVPRLAEALN